LRREQLDQQQQVQASVVEKFSYMSLFSTKGQC
jgi:hypothetical protein